MSETFHALRLVGQCISSTHAPPEMAIVKISRLCGEDLSAVYKLTWVRSCSLFLSA